MSTYVIGGTVKSIKYNSSGKIDACYFAPDQEFVVKTNYTNYKYHCAVFLPKDDAVIYKSKCTSLVAFSHPIVYSVLKITAEGDIKEDAGSVFLFNLDESEYIELKNISQYSFLRVNGHYIFEFINDDSIPDSDKNITICSKNFKVNSIIEIP